MRWLLFCTKSRSPRQSTVYTNYKTVETTARIPRIAGKFRGRKVSRISRFCGYSQSFLREIWRHGVLSSGKSEQSAQVFSAKIYQSAKVFSLESFPLYGSVIYIYNNFENIKTQRLNILYMMSQWWKVDCYLAQP